MNELKEKTITVIEADPQKSRQGQEDRILRVAAYCRVSTDKEDQLHSYDAQVAYYTEYISKNPKWKFVDIYSDEGVSGTGTKKRTGFKKMIADCNKGKIDLILTKSVSRFARNTVDSLQYVRQLKSKGVGVFFEEQNINTLSEESEMYIGIYSVIAQTESENISANIRWGIQKRMKNGTFKVRMNILGYTYDDNGNVIIVPEEANTVKFIFAKYLEGYSRIQIKNMLIENGNKMKKGGTNWNGEDVIKILKNEKYVGDAILQKTFIKDCISKKSIKNTGELPQYLISNDHVPIIDREIFNKVQLEISRRGNLSSQSDKGSTFKGKYSGKFALTRMLICGNCGRTYRRRINASKKEKVVYWRCMSTVEHGMSACPKSYGIREPVLHEAIMKAIQTKFPNTTETIEKVHSNINSLFSEDDVQSLIANYEMEISKLEKSVESLMDFCINSGCNQEKIETEMEQNYSKIKLLREKIAKQQKILKSHNTIVQRENESNPSDSVTPKYEYDDMVVRELIDKIIVNADKTISVNFKDGEIKTVPLKLLS